MITADLSDHLSFKFMDADIRTVSREYSKLDPVLRESIESRYRDTITLSPERPVLHAAPTLNSGVVPASRTFRRFWLFANDR